MKTNLVRHGGALAVGLFLLGGCARPAAQSQQTPAVFAGPAPQTVVVTPSNPDPTPSVSAPAQSAQPAALSASPSDTNVASTNLSLTQTSTGTNGVPTNAPPIEQVIPPAQPENMSAGLGEVVRLAQGGVSEEVMLTYIEKFNGPFNLTAEQIVYLNDLGVTSAVVNSMLNKDGKPGIDAAAVAPDSAAAPLTQTQAVSNLPGAPVNQLPSGVEPPPAGAEVPTVAPAATPPVNTEVSYFYDSLSPYGSWVYVGGYGWCWQPTVAYANHEWRPYFDGGRWYWSDAGWYWHSDYSWGWAPFHYGRWYYHGHRGWLWTPGAVWGPSWVSWRYTDGYCGWAPLPPAAHWHGHGFSYYGSHVAVGFDFGLLPFHYTFVTIGGFHHHHLHHHRVHRSHAHNVYHRTRVVNHFGVERNTVVNRGIGRETIARASGSEIRQVRLQGASVGENSRVGRIERRGNDLVAYRAELPKNPGTRPQQVQRRMGQDLAAARMNQPHTTRMNLGGNTGASAATRRNEAATRPVGGGDRGVGVAGPINRNDGSASRAVPRQGRSSAGEAAAPQGRSTQPAQPAQPAPQREVAPRRNESAPPRQNIDRPQRQERPERGQRAEAITGRSSDNVGRATPQMAQPRAEVSRPQARAATPAPAPRVDASPARPVFPEARAVTPSRAAPSAGMQGAPNYSPRYNEQRGGGQMHAAPRQVAPRSVAPAAPSFSAPGGGREAVRAQPSAPRTEAFRGGGGGGGGAGHRGGGGGPGGGGSGGGRMERRN